MKPLPFWKREKTPNGCSFWRQADNILITPVVHLLLSYVA